MLPRVNAPHRRIRFPRATYPLLVSLLAAGALALFASVAPAAGLVQTVNAADPPGVVVRTAPVIGPAPGDVGLTLSGSASNGLRSIFGTTLTAAFTMTGSVHKAGQAVVFADSSSGLPATWAWTFGDGATSNLRSPTHAFSEAGRYTVALTTTNATGTSVATGLVLVIPAWTGTEDLYRPGVFSTQATSSWCVPASAQMILNVVEDRSVHSSAEQSRFYAIGRSADRYSYSWPGVDPQGEVGILTAAGLPGYRVVAGTSFASTLRYAVTRLRLTGEPVGLFVGLGTHAWVLAGFSATRDPAVTSNFSVTAVYVLGPFWPNQTARYGYFDLAPNSRLTTARFAIAFTPYHDQIRTIWDGRYVVVAP